MRISAKSVEISLVFLDLIGSLEHHHEDFNVDLLNIMTKFHKAFHDAEAGKVDIKSALEKSDKIERERHKKSFDIVLCHNNFH